MINKLLFIFLFLCSCASIGPFPRVSLCSFDNSTVLDSSQIVPNFKCIGADDTEYKIHYKSKSADKMFAIPHDEFIDVMNYIKKILEEARAR